MGSALATPASHAQGSKSHKSEGKQTCLLWAVYMEPRKILGFTIDICHERW